MRITEAQGSGRGLEAMKWIIVAVLLIVAIVGNFLYRDIMLAVRAGRGYSYCCCRWRRAVDDER